MADPKHDGSWGGAECPCAISNIKNSRINVYHANSTHPVVFVPKTRSFTNEVHPLYPDHHYDNLTPRSITTSLVALHHPILETSQSHSKCTTKYYTCLHKPLHTHRIIQTQITYNTIRETTITFHSKLWQKMLLLFCMLKISSSGVLLNCSIRFKKKHFIIFFFSRNINLF